MEWFIQSDQIAIDGNEAWLVDRNENILYKADLSNFECEFISILPTPMSIKEEPLSFYRINPCCYKKKDSIFLMPDRGDSILVQDLEKKEISKVEINNPCSVRLSIHNFWEDSGKLWAVSQGLGKILMIDIESKSIEGYYDIFDEPDLLPGYEAIKRGNCIFNVSKNANKICVFDIKLKEKRVYEIYGVSEGLYTICYVDGRFWFSGISGRIYFWEEKQRKLGELNEYPIDLKLYKEEKEEIKEIEFPSAINIPIFYRSFFVEEYICFLPLNSNQALCNQLLCVNRKDYHMKTIELVESQNIGAGLYTLEYLNPDNVAGILSEKKLSIMEINIEKNIVNQKYLKKKDQTALLYWNIQRNNVIYEVPDLALKEYRNAIYGFLDKKAKTELKYGKLIFEKLLKKY